MEMLSIADLTLYGGLTSVAVVVVTELTKFVALKLKVKVAPQFIVLFLALLLGAAYQSYSVLMPDGIKEAIWAYIVGSMGFATMIYTFLIKPIKSKIK